MTPLAKKLVLLIIVLVGMNIFGVGEAEALALLG